MKKIPVIVWLPLVFVAGGLVGYYGPAEELRSRDVREQEEKAKPKSKKNKLKKWQKAKKINLELVQFLEE